MSTTNPNLSVVRRKAVELGASIVSIREGPKHTIVTLRTREGRHVQMALSRSRIDNFIMEGWTRQALRRLPRDYQLMEVANDNEITPPKAG